MVFESSAPEEIQGPAPSVFWKRFRMLVVYPMALILFFGALLVATSFEAGIFILLLVAGWWSVNLTRALFDRSAGIWVVALAIPVLVLIHAFTMVGLTVAQDLMGASSDPDQWPVPEGPNVRMLNLDVLLYSLDQTLRGLGLDIIEGLHLNTTDLFGWFAPGLENIEVPKGHPIAYLDAIYRSVVTLGMGAALGRIFGFPRAMEG